MAYSKTTWTNGSGNAINATNLNHIETGIDEAHDAIDNISTGHDHDGIDSKKVDSSNVINTPTGNIVAIDTQAAITELDGQDTTIQGNLTTHESDTSTHGVAEVADVATVSAEIDSDITTHAALPNAHHDESHSIVSHDTTVTGAELNADHSKLTGVEDNAKDDQTGSEIVTLINAGGDLIDDNNIAATIARDSEVATAVSTHAALTASHGVAAIADQVTVSAEIDSDIATHAAAADPHTIYQLESEKGNANGYPDLDAGGKVPQAQLPLIALTQVFTAASEILQLALTVEEGDVCVRTDENKSYIALNSDNVDMSDWQVLLTPTDAVTSVFGRAGVVSAQSDDYTWAQIDKAASDLADITTKSHTSLTDKGTTTHADLDTDHTKLAGIDAGAKDDQTGAEIKALYEAEADTNAYDDAAASKVAGIDAGADVTADNPPQTHAMSTHTDEGALATLSTVDTAQIDADAVTYAKMQNVSADERILGNITAVDSPVTELTKAQVLNMLSVEDGATPDQTGAEIKTAYEGEADTNEFSDAEKTKLGTVDTDADVTGSNSPQAHEASHKSGGSDEILLDELGTPTDIATLNATTSAHGLLKKLDNSSTNFMNGQGNWAPAGAATPTGIISMWHGLIANIPAGWVLCDGNNSTPDLRSKFLRGAPAATEAGGTGGADTHTLSENEMPAHTHGYNEGPVETTGGNNQGSYEVQSQNATVTDSTGGGVAHNNMPSYYQILFVMKT